MGSKFTSKTITGYNASPQADDGSTTTSNKLEWAKHKQKLADPVKTLAEQINSALVDHFDVGPVAVSVDTTTAASHYNQVLEVTGTTTISLMTAATAGKGYFVTVQNSGSNTVTIDLATGTNTLDGSVGGSTTLAANEAKTFIVNASANGYISRDSVVANPAKTDTDNSFSADQSIVKSNPIETVKDTAATAVIKKLLKDSSGNNRVIQTYVEDTTTPDNSYYDIGIYTSAGAQRSFVRVYESGRVLIKNLANASYFEITSAGKLSLVPLSSQTVDISTGVSGTAIETTLAGSASKLVTSSAIKAYVDNDVVSTLSSATTLGASDSGKTFLVDGTTAFTIAFDASATLGSGWRARFLMINATNPVTLDPNGTETIGGEATRRLNVVNDVIEVVCDGSNLQILDDSTDISFRVSNTAGSSQTPAASVVTWPTEDSDTNGSFASNGFTIPVDGKYSFSAAVLLSGVDANAYVELHIYVDYGAGPVAVLKGERNRNGGTAVSVGASVSAELTLSQGDIVYIYLEHSSSASKTLHTAAGRNWFIGSRIK